MTSKLMISAIIKFICGMLLVGLLIFLPAGTIRFFNGWILMSVLFIPMFIAGVVMIIKKPDAAYKTTRCKRKKRGADSGCKTVRSDVSCWFYCCRT